MTVGPGKYDDLASYCLKQSNAKAVVVIVFKGDKGSGMSGKERVVITPDTVDYEIVGELTQLRTLAKVLRDVAKTIEETPVETFLAAEPRAEN